jgi:hypothetical protein
VEALRTLFQRDLLARKPFASPGGLFDRTERQWIVVDVDGTRQAARQRALPQTEDLPAPHRQFDQVCAPGYQGRKRGEVVRTCTVVREKHTHQFLGTFGGSGNGDYRSELRRAIQVITTYATHLRLPTASILVRLDGLYGDAAPLLDVLSADLGVIARSRAYHLLDLEMVKQTLARTPVHVSAPPESGMTRTLYDCPAVPLTPTSKEVRSVVATHPVTTSSSPVGVERDGTVYELFVSTLPSPAFTASDVLDLYLHRGSFETVRASEDVEQNADRWYSHTPCGQGFSQILAQWAWNLRLELGQQLSSTELRTTEFAPALEAELVTKEEPAPADSPASSVIYGPPQWARPSFTGGFSGSAFSPQPDGTLRCPANHPLYPQERRPERGLSADLVCGTHRPLPFLSSASTVSREPHHAQTTPGECGAVAAGRFSLGFLASSGKSASRASSGPGPLERLATLWNPTRLAHSDPKPNRPARKHHPCRSFTCPGADLANLDPSEARALASVLGGAACSQCSPLRRSQAGCHAPRSPGHLCALFWL